MSKNRNLREAKTAKNDEFYTSYSDVSHEMKALFERDPGFFANRTVLCPCNDLEHPGFRDFFIDNFQGLGLRRLTCTSYVPGHRGHAETVSLGRDGNIKVARWVLDGDGDFRSPEITKFMQHSDLVVTNPPFSCFSSDTEVLTDEGWKLFTDVKPGDLVLSMDPVTRKVEYAHIVRFYDTPYKGELFHFKKTGMDLMVTGNHRMICNERKDLFCRADEVVPHYHSVPIRGLEYDWSGIHEEFFTLPSVMQNERYTHKDITVPEKKIPMGDWLEFLGFWLADGCVRFGNNVNGNPRYTISIKQNEDNEKYVIDLYAKIGFPCKVERSSKTRNHNYTVYSKQLWTYLAKFGKGIEKKFPTEVLYMEPAYMARFLDGYMKGNSQLSHIGGKVSQAIGSTAPKLCEGLQELILKVRGVLVQFIQRKSKGNPYWMANWAIETKKRNTDYPVPEKVQYDGTVHCLELDRNHTMLVRRNGLATWCGNCFRDFVDWVDSADRDFYVIGNKNCVNYNEVFRKLRSGRIQLGITSPDEFETPEGETEKVTGLCRWYTNMSVPRKEDERGIFLKATYDPAKYPKFENFDAINVDRISDIPKDYDGVMGVPITFFDHFDPKQFEVLGRSGDTAWAFNECGFFTPPPEERQKAYKAYYKNWRVQNSYLLDENGMPKCIYYRVFIRRRQ